VSDESANPADRTETATTVDTADAADTTETEADGGETLGGASSASTVASLQARWESARDRELTVIGLTIVGVSLFPYLFARAPVVSDLLQGYQELASLMLVWGIFAIGFNILLGRTGLLSFGHAALWGTGAYAAGWASANITTFPLLLVAIGVVTAVFLSMVLGWLSLRRGGIYFAILTLAFAQMIYYMASAPLAFITGGDNGLTGVEIGSLLGVFDLGTELPSVAGTLLGTWRYAFIGVFLVLSVAAIYRILNSPYGIVFQAIRENEQRAEFVGFNVWRYKLAAFVLSGTFAGLAGALFTIHGQYVPLSSLYWQTSGEVVIMTVLGGVGSLLGPLFGAGIYLWVEYIVSGGYPFDWIAPYWLLVLGLVFVTVVVLFPEGIWGLVGDLRDRVATRLEER
jgi:branched-chain amino acid transport system permease protein